MFYLLLVIACVILQNPVGTVVAILLWWFLHKKSEEADEKRYAEMNAKYEAKLAAAKAERAAQKAMQTKTLHSEITASISSPTTKSIFEIEEGILTAYRANEDFVVIPNHVTIIGTNAFKNSPELKQITIPSSVKKIEKEAFADCRKLLRVEIPNSVDSISDGAFLRCNHLEIITLPAGIQRIEKNSFLSCRNLMEINLPEELVSIGQSAFAYCSNLQNISLPHGLINIETAAFAECSKLESVSIPSGVVLLSNRVFAECHQLKKVVFPTGIIEIGAEAFFRCCSLRSMNLPDSLKKIGVRAFAYCENFRNIDIPDGTTDIDDYAFFGCSNLTSISIPESVTFIGDEVFDGCNELLTIRATAGSAAERYAVRNDIRFSAVVVQDKIVPVIHEIDFADFVVKSNAFSCYFNHNVETIQAFVSILLRDGTICKEKTIAAYCKDCNCYYILESSFKALQQKGVLLCQLITLNELKGKGISVFSGENMKAQSMLRRCGYTVNATDDLSVTQRQKILALVLDNHIYTASELYNFLDWLINYHGRSKRRNMSAAIEKWTIDRDFVAKYKVNTRRTVGINSLSYRN